jgi:hypothetical protein
MGHVTSPSQGIFSSQERRGKSLGTRLQVFDQNHLVENNRKYTKHSGENANFQLNNFGTTHVDILKRISALKRTLKIGHHIEIKLDYYM